VKIRTLVPAIAAVTFLATLAFENHHFSRQSEAEAAGAKTGAVTDNVKDLFVELSKKLVPSVVNIYTTQTIQNPYGGPQAELYRRFFEQFFGEDFGGQGGGGGAPPPGPRTQKATSLGSGFIIDEKEGLILTNYHVIADADEVKVILTEEDADREGIDATIVGGDAEADVALVKIKTSRKLTAAALGDSDVLQVGEWVMAVGNPFGHGHTVTKGIISAKERVVGPMNQFSNYLQTDTPINPGNSGGPLINTAGEVIGINAAINAAAQGIGFAIPINYVKHILPELRSKGAVTRGFIGVNISELNPNLAAGMKLPKNTRGVVVSEVIEGEPGAKAGLKRYDVILSINDKKILDGRQLVNTVSTFAPGTTITVRVLRGGKEKDIKVTVGKRPTREKITQKSGPGGKLQGPKLNLGMQVSELDDDARKDLGMPSGVHGVVVESVAEGGAAEEAGLEPNDVIVEVDQKPVTNLRAFNAMFKEPRIYLISFQHEGEGVAITSLDLTKKAAGDRGEE
jgi:serine protease Do